jgi:hypothetical protein
MTNGRIRTCVEDYESVLEALEELARAAHELKTPEDRHTVAHHTRAVASRLRVLRLERAVHS